jgi:Family of unknown function (DUF6134)
MINQKAISAMLRKMTRLGSFFLLGTLACDWTFTQALANPPLPEGSAAIDPLALYGPEIRFDVHRAGARIGSHRVTFSATPQGIRAVAEVGLTLELLSIAVFRFRYSSQSLWRDGHMHFLRAEANDDGRTSKVEAERRGGLVEIRNDQVRTTLAAPLFPTEHWSAAVLKENRVLNTLTGRLNTVRIEPNGSNMVTTERGNVAAFRYTYHGDLRTDVWYDGKGRWVKMRFMGNDGSQIDYVCRLCQGPATP